VNISISPKQIIAASVIATGSNKKEAAIAANVTPQTISKWMQLPEFEALINQIKLDLLKEAQDKLRGLVSQAILTLASLIKDSENDRIRLETAKYILNTINIAPHKEMGLWLIGPTTYEDALMKKAKNEQVHLGSYMDEL
jgi:hypothetical protein